LRLHQEVWILSGSTQRLVDVLFASSLTYSLVMGLSPNRAASYWSLVYNLQ